MKNNFSIISDDCWSFSLHQSLGLSYKTPFVDIYTDNKEFLTLVENFYTINLTNIRQVNKEMYVRNGGLLFTSNWESYPVVCIDDKVIIHPIHCKSYVEFMTKWVRRVAKMEHHRLLFKFCTTEFDEAEKFLELLPAEHKILYSDHPELHSPKDSRTLVLDSHDYYLGDDVTSTDFSKVTPLLESLSNKIN